MITLIVTLIIFGALVWLVNNLIPMDSKFRLVINFIIGLFLFLYVLDFFGLYHLPRNVL